MKTEKLKKKLGQPKTRKPIAPPTIKLKVKKKEKIDREHAKEIDLRDLCA
jgi:hypothetical protein